MRYWELYKRICIDVDVYKPARWTWTRRLGVIRALLMYSWMPRQIVVTRHGYHIYLPVEHNERTFYYRWFMGDDELRWLRDLRRIEYTKHYVNICFKNSELGESTVWDALEVVAWR